LQRPGAQQPLGASQQPAEPGQPGESYQRGNNRYFKDEEGRVGRVHTPESVSRQGGYEDRGSQNVRFETEQGDPLGDMEAVAHEININNPEKLAWVERGRILQKTGQLTRMQKASGSISGLRQTTARMHTAQQLGRMSLTSFGRAKANQIALGQAGMAGTYRKALMEGDHKRANLTAEQHYRTGGDPAMLAGIAQEVNAATKGTNPLDKLEPEQTQMLVQTYQEILGRGDPNEMAAFAFELDAMGFEPLADAVRNAGGEMGKAFRSESSQAGLAERSRISSEQSERRFQAGRDDELYDRQTGQRKMAQGTRRLDLQQGRDEYARAKGGRAEGRAERYIDVREQEAEAARTRYGRAEKQKRYGQVVSDLQKFARERTDTIEGVDPINTDTLKQSVLQIVDESDKAAFIQAYDANVGGNIDPIQAAVRALRAIGKASGGARQAAPQRGGQPQLQPAGDPNDPSQY
jgi:hypothetical protein